MLTGILIAYLVVGIVLGAVVGTLRVVGERSTFTNAQFWGLIIKYTAIGSVGWFPMICFAIFMDKYWK
jgi:amino acid permease